MFGLHSGSSSSYSNSEYSSARLPHIESTLLEPRDHLGNWSVSVPTLNKEHHFVSGHESFVESDRLTNHKNIPKSGKNCEGEDDLNKELEKYEKPERKYNSKELIEKQKNWTSHFSKARPNRHYSDPNKSLIESSLNNVSSKIGIDENLSINSQENFILINDKEFMNKLVDISNNSAMRSASFCSTKPCLTVSPPPPPPPPLPIRNSSSVNVRKGQPVSIACLTSISSKHMEYPINKFNTPSNAQNNVNIIEKHKFLENNKEIPEYATIQKNTDAKKAITILNEITSESNLKMTLSYETSSELMKLSMKNISANLKDNSIISETSNCFVDCNESPSKTSEWKNDWLFKNEKILKDLNKFEYSCDSSFKSESNIGVNDNEAQLLGWIQKPSDALHKKISKIESSTIKTSEHELMISGMANTSSRIISPYSPPRSSKEEKADKEISEKVQIGKYECKSKKIILFLKFV